MTEERAKMAVRATAVGFYGGARRRKGDVFEVPEGVLGKWFVPVDATLAEKNRIALEEAAKAKKKAEDDHRAAKIKAEQDAKEAKAKADKQLTDARETADQKAKTSFLGGLLPGAHKTKPQVQEEGGEAGGEETPPADESTEDLV